MRFLLVDDHILFRESLRLLLHKRGFQVVGEAGDGAQAVAQALCLKPDVVLMDLRMDGMSGLEAIAALRGELPNTRIVVVTSSNDDRDLLAALRAGADGYVLKSETADTFVGLLARLADNGSPIAPSLSSRARAALTKPHEPNGHAPSLTEAEQRVVELMTEGITSNRGLARRLGVSENTIKFHMRNLLDKYHLHDRAQLVGHTLRRQVAAARGHSHTHSSPVVERSEFPSGPV